MQGRTVAVDTRTEKDGGGRISEAKENNYQIGQAAENINTLCRARAVGLRVVP